MRKLLPFLAGGMLLVVAFNFVRTIRRLSGISPEVQGLRDEVTAMEQERKKLEAQIAEAETPEFVEREVREKLGWGKEGEVILVLPDQNQVTSNKQQETIEENLENWERWLKTFGW